MQIAEEIGLATDATAFSFQFHAIPCDSTAADGLCKSSSNGKLFGKGENESISSDVALHLASVCRLLLSIRRIIFGAVRHLWNCADGWEARRNYTERAADANAAYTLYDRSDLSYSGLAREPYTLYDASTVGKESTTAVIRLS